MLKNERTFILWTKILEDLPIVRALAMKLAAASAARNAKPAPLDIATERITLVVMPF